MSWIDEINKIEQTHGLMIFVRGREDAEAALGREMTDDEWDKVLSSYEWRKASGNETINELINEEIDNALYECNLDPCR